MPPKRRRFERPIGQRRYRKLFIIAAEGIKTEPRYFGMFNNQQSVVKVSCLRGNHETSPPQVLRRMEKHLQQESLKKGDEAWLVVDKDHWTDEQLRLLYEWSQQQANYGFDLSNPKFEYWLLLHFEDGNGISNTCDCSERLKRYLPEYDKGIDKHKVTREMIDAAIRRARQRDNPPCADWPRAIGGTTVYKLVQNILLP
jgi:hypothetical protein